MSDSTKMTRSGAATLERVEAGAGLAGSSTSISNDTTTAGSRQFRISNLLLTGEENAVPMKHIKQLVPLPNREIRRQIQLEREQHITIVSDHNGYYLAGTELERERFVRSMRHRAAEIVKVAEAVERGEIGGDQVRTSEIF